MPHILTAAGEGEVMNLLVHAVTLFKPHTKELSGLHHIFEVVPVEADADYLGLSHLARLGAGHTGELIDRLDVVLALEQRPPTLLESH